jgi:hypothetical protein
MESNYDAWKSEVEERNKNLKPGLFAEASLEMKK